DVVIGKRRDVAGIIQTPVPLHHHLGWVVLPVAGQTDPAWPGYMRPPHGPSHATTGKRVGMNSPINDGDDVRISQGIEHVSRPGTVDAGEHHVEVERTPQPFRLTDAEFECFVPRELSCRSV